MPWIRPFALAAIGASALALAACGTTPEEEPDEPRDAHGLPGWYVERETPGEPLVIYGFGASQAEPDYPDQMRRQARMAAAAEIAEQLTQTVQTLNSEYFDREDLGRDEDARTRQELRQTTEQWVDQTLVGVSIERSDVTDDGRWVVMAQYDLEQDFDAYLNAIDAEDEALRRDLRSSAEDHLDRLRERVGD